MRSPKAWCVWASLGVLAACQCFTPVDELDGGSGAGGGSVGAGSVGGGNGGGNVGGGNGGGNVGGGNVGGGNVGGGGARCSRASDCPGNPGALAGLCSGVPGSWSCAMGACVVECAGGRTCTATTSPQCLICDGSTSCANEPMCPWLTHLSFERSTCGLSPLELWKSLPTAQPCERTLLFPDGVVAGTIWGFSYAAIRAEIPSLGGHCVGIGLPTGAVRFTLSCPSCSAFVRPEIVGP